MSQHQFGQQVGGYSQSQISKYESGEDPPAALIERCMQMVAEKRDATFEISGPELAARLQKIMATPELTGVGHAIAAILAAVESRQVGRPNKRSAQN